MSLVIYIHKAANADGQLGALGGVKLSASQIKAYWLAAGGDPSKATLMTAIALAESAGWTGAVNPGRGAGGRPTNEYSVGLWQINTLVHKNYSREQLKDPTINAREAVRILKLQGLRAWGAYTDGRYRAYMAAAGGSAGVVPTTATAPPNTTVPGAGWDFTCTPEQNAAGTCFDLAVTVSASDPDVIAATKAAEEQTTSMALLGLLALALLL